MSNRCFRITFDPKLGVWVIEFMVLNLVFYTKWRRMMTRQPTTKENAPLNPLELATFSTCDEAYAFVKTAGIEKIYTDVTRGMPYQHNVDQNRPVTAGEVASMLREVVASDRAASAQPA